MRTDRRVDQADGLRRLLVSNQTRVITLLAGKSGVGNTSAVINLAAALARSGKAVLVLDENNTTHNVSSHLGLHAKRDLLDVIKGRCKLSEALLNAGSFSVLSTARTMCALTTSKFCEWRESDSENLDAIVLDHHEQQRLESALNEVGSSVDVVLVDAAMPVMRKVEAQAESNSAQVPCSMNFLADCGDFYTVSSSLARGAALLVVVDATASGITESYSLIKRLALDNARLQFEIVVNKVADDRVAKTVFENMEMLARRNLAARLDYLGCVPQDDRLMRAMQLGKSVVEAFPSAVSADAYMDLANKLLNFPMRQTEAESGVHNVIRDLIQQAALPRIRSRRTVVSVVN